ncbi:LuxR family transcriptional regulator [Pseudonocardia nematodicida]|uniref:LuxR family transcriptional regulator n=1 Tax=Pseudonocardia nematodicida TaxID=1206997 RepID=A0ABV1KI93_9PSEU
MSVGSASSAVVSGRPWPVFPEPGAATPLRGATTTELIGRGAETAALDRWWAGVADAAGSALVLWGEPGIGKTALLEYAVAAAAGGTVLRCRGTRTEAGLEFAALHELLWPVVDRLDILPAPQATALRGALGLGGEPAARFLVGAAVLSLVSDLARQRPVLVVVDDAQWVDEATAHCLGFLARRVRSEAVGVLFTGYEDPAAGPWEGLPSIEVVGLADDDARRLVDAVLPGADRGLADHVIRTAGGNPLALRELCTLDLRPEPGGAPRRPFGNGAPLGPRLRRAFGARVAAMEPSTRALLLLAAAEDRGAPHVVHHAGSGWGVDPAAWDQVRRSGLLRTSGSRVEFRHPLIPAAVYDGAAFTERQAAHRALADALPEDAAEERAWHLAAAADAADEDVAALLERSAGERLRHDAGPTAMRALRRAAELSPAPADAVRRLAAGARAAWDAGHASAAGQLLDDAERLGGEVIVARHSGGLRGILESAHGVPERAHHYLTRDMTAVDGARCALELGTTAVHAAWSAGRTDLRQQALRRLREVDARVEVDDDPSLTALLPVLRSWWSCYDGTGGPAPAAPDGGADTVGVLGALTWELLPPAPLAQAWGIEGPVLDVLRLRAARLRRRHERSGLAVVLSRTAVLDLAAGRWGGAMTAASDGLRLAEEVGADHVAAQCRTTLAALAAARGDRAVVDEHATRVLQVSVPRGVRALTAEAYLYRGRAALFAGQPHEALHDLTALAEPGHEAAHPTFALLAAVDTAEAAVQAGHTDVAESRLTTVSAWAQRSGAAWARAAAHRLRALVRGGAAAEDAYRAALDVPGAADHPFEHARTRLLYGEWLRRARRRADARHQLAAAAQVFDRLGAEPLRRRALREQDLTNGPVARNATGPSAELTAQELRIARLAAEGLTNREIAARLLISPRTVGHHLANVYPKLGITSRARLARIEFAGELRVGGAGPVG